MYLNRLLALAATIVALVSALAPLYENLGPGARPIPGRFIVKMKNDVSQATFKEVENLIDDFDHVYELASFKGLAGRLNDTAIESLRAHPGVAYIESDQLDLASSYVTQHGAPWGLGRISHKSAGIFTDNTTYVYDDSAGEGVCAYVIDSGIRVDHEEFEGRAESVANFAVSSGEDDITGHGTHVAGTIGGATYGVAKKVKLYSVKTGDHSAVESELLDAMAFVANDTQTRHCPNGTVANLSWTFPRSHALNDMSRAVLDAGVFLAISSGNQGVNADLRSPASEPSICTVGATDNSNHMAWFSNYGSVVDILAPGVDVLSASFENTTASALMSGTSMATPHIVGLAAYLLASKHIEPQALCDHMVSIASPVITDLEEETVNLVAFNGNPEG